MSEHDYKDYKMDTILKIYYNGIDWFLILLIVKSCNRVQTIKSKQDGQN